VGALRFKSRKLAPGKSVTYLIYMGLAKDKKEAQSWIKAYGSVEKTQEALEHTQAYWKERLDRIQVETDDKDFGRWARWVTIQPILRKIFGCSFLPDFDTAAAAVVGAISGRTVSPFYCWMSKQQAASSKQVTIRIGKFPARRSLLAACY